MLINQKVSTRNHWQSMSGGQESGGNKGQEKKKPEAGGVQLPV